MTGTHGGEFRYWAFISYSALCILPGTYTAIVGGTNGGTGVGLVEVYNLP